MIRKLFADKVVDLDDPDYQFYVFDRSGRLAVTKYGSYQYNKAGRLISIKSNEGQTDYKRDKAGRVVGEVYSNVFRGELSYDSQNTLRYDAKGRLSEFFPSFHEAMFSSTLSLSYDEQNRIVEVIHSGGFDECSYFKDAYTLTYRGSTICIENVEYTHDEKQRLICLEVKDTPVYNFGTLALGLRSKKSTYKYNAQGLLAEQEDIDFEDKTTKTWYTYDSHSNLLKVLKQSGENEPEIAEEYSYKYDTYGNWIEKITVVGTEPSVRRAIIYYE